MKKILSISSFLFAALSTLLVPASILAEITVVGDGTVSSSIAEPNAGDTVTLTATPATGKHFFRWAGAIGNADPLEPVLSYKVPEGGAMPTAYFGNKIVVDVNGGGAYTTIDEAVTAAQDYDTVFVKDGTYVRTSTSYLNITKPIALVSENGADRTFIQGTVAFTADSSKTWNRGLHINNSLAVVKGFNIHSFGNDGGDANNKGLAFRLYDGLVEYCTASNCRPNWGGIAIQQTGGELRHSLMIRNRNNQNSTDAGWCGAGLLLTGGTATNCVIRNCSASYAAHGGGACVNGANAKLLGCTISGSSAAGSGGGIYLVNGLVDNCVITNNSGNAGGVYQTGGTLSNSLIAYNKNSYGQKYGGVNSTGGTIDNCQIHSNIAYYPEGMQLRKTAGTVSNTVAADSKFGIPSSALVAVSAGVTVQNCSFQCPGVNGSAELNASEFFKDGADYIRASKLVGTAPMTAEFAVVRNGVAGTPWQKTFETCGEFTEEADGLSCTVRVLSTTTFVSKSGSDTFPYDTAEKATPDFQKAHDAVYADDTVHGEIRVAADTYTYTGSDVSGTFTPWLFVNKNVTVKGGTDDPEDTKFDANRKIMTLFLFHPKAVLESINVSNGRYNANGPQYGGSLHMMAGFVTNCIIEKGFCNYGGNASVRGGSIIDTVFRNGTLNQSGEDRPGGGLQVRGAATITSCFFTGNTGGLGSGFSCHDSGAVVSNCVIRGNSGGICGGSGIGLIAGLVTHCVISNNTSSTGGGGVRVSGGTLRNCLVVNNRANGTAAPDVGYNKAGGGGICINSGTVENCTVYGNASSSSTRCDELYQKGGTVRNCVFLGKDDTAANDVYKTAGTATYCYFRTTVSGTGNISGDAKLSAPANGDFTLGYGSPCIDAGMEIAAVTSDITGKARPIDGNGNGTAETDIGCYEYEIDLTAINASFDADVTQGGGSVTVTLTAEVSGGTAPYRYVWNFGDGTDQTTTVPEVIHTFGYGSHNVTLTVYDANNNASEPVERKGLVSVKAPVVYMSPDGSAEWPYATWETATPELADAVGAIYATDEVPGKIWVADGTYTSSDQNVFSADLSLPIELVGTNTEIGATFVGQAASSVVHKSVKVNNAKSKVANLHFTSYRGNANTDCSVIWIYSGLVTNCKFDNCNAWGAGMIYQVGGLISDCLLSGNDGGMHSGGDRWGAIYMDGGTAERLVITGCTGGNCSAAKLCGTTAVLRDSVIRNNTNHAGASVYLSSGLLENCVITNNTSSGEASQGSAFAHITGSGVLADGKGAVVRNCLIAGNKVSSSPATAGSLYVAGSATNYNNTVWANTLKDGSTNDVYLASGAVKNTIAGVMTTAGGNEDHNRIGFEPGFRDLAKDDFRLAYDSPCKDAGDLSIWGDRAAAKAATDLAGNKRLFGDNIDIGCYELRYSPFKLILK